MGVGSRDAGPGMFSTAVWRAGTLGLLASVVRCEWRSPLTAGLKSRCQNLSSVDTAPTCGIGPPAAGWCGHEVNLSLGLKPRSSH